MRKIYYCIYVKKATTIDEFSTEMKTRANKQELPACKGSGADSNLPMPKKSEGEAIIHVQ